MTKNGIFLVSSLIVVVTGVGVYALEVRAATEPAAKKSAAATEQPSALEQQTELLIQALVNKGYVGSASPQETKEKSAPEIETDVYKEFAIFREAKRNGSKKPDRKAQQAYRQYNFHEGDSIYRVAVADKLLTLDEAIQVGVANAIEAKAFAKKIDVARSKVTEARRALFPTAQIVTEINGGKAGATETNLGGRIFKGKNWKVNVTQPVFYGGELVYTVKQAETNWKSAIEEYKKKKNDAVSNVKIAYLSCVKNEYNVDYQAELYKDVNTLYRRVRLEHQKKLISDIDYLNAEQQYYQSYFQFESAKNEIMTARIALYQALGVDIPESLTLDLNLEFKPVRPGLAETLELAMRQSADVRIKELALESAEWGIKIYKAKKFPKIDLRGSYGKLGEIFKDTEQLASDNHDLDTEKEWYLGVGVNMPLGPNTIEYEQIKHKYGPTVLALNGSEDWKHSMRFNLFDKFPDITDGLDAEATYLQAQADLDKAKNETLIKVRGEFYNMQKALLQIDSALAKLRYQTKQVAAYRFLVGLQETTVSNLMEGLVSLAQDRFTFIQSVVDYHTAVAALNNTLGDPDYFKSR